MATPPRFLRHPGAEEPEVSPPRVRTVKKTSGEEERRVLLAASGDYGERSTQYSLAMADRIACSCVTCPKCGAWVVVKQQRRMGETQEKFRATCPVPECGKEFAFELGETRVFDLPLLLFERLAAARRSIRRV